MDYRPSPFFIPALNIISNFTEKELRVRIKAVLFFAKDADRQGLRIPGSDDSFLNPKELKKIVFDDLEDVLSHKKTFPLPEWRTLFGMAQHYGIPTRLLDWTESASIAAYFAASEAAKLIIEKEKGIGNQEDIGRQIVVWAVNTNIFEEISLQHEEEIYVVRVPWESNPNLRAQRGLFTLHHKKLEVLGNLENVDGLDEAIEKLIEKNNKTEILPPGPFIYCLRLDINNHHAYYIYFIRRVLVQHQFVLDMQGFLKVSKKKGIVAFVNFIAGKKNVIFLK